MRNKFNFDILFSAFEPRVENSYGSPIDKFSFEAQEADIEDRVVKLTGQPTEKSDGTWGFNAGLFQVIFCTLDLGEDQRFYVDKGDFSRLLGLTKTHKILPLYLGLRLLFDIINNHSNVPENEKLPEPEPEAGWIDLTPFDFARNCPEGQLPDTKAVIKLVGDWDYNKDRKPKFQLLPAEKLETSFLTLIEFAKLGMLDSETINQNVNQLFQNACRYGSYRLLISISIFKTELDKVNDAFKQAPIKELMGRLGLVKCFLDGIEKNENNTNDNERGRMARFLLIKSYPEEDMEALKEEGWISSLRRLSAISKSDLTTSAVTVTTTTTTTNLKRTREAMPLDEVQAPGGKRKKLDSSRSAFTSVATTTATTTTAMTTAATTTATTPDLKRTREAMEDDNQERESKRQKLDDSGSPSRSAATAEKTLNLGSSSQQTLSEHTSTPTMGSFRWEQSLPAAPPPSWVRQNDLNDDPNDEEHQSLSNS